MNNKLTVKERKSMFRRWIFSAGLGYNYESQQAPSVAFSMRKALRKIYPDDDEYIAAMDNHYNYFNATPQMANVILGATLAMEEEDGIGAKDAVQSLKTSLMGPLSGVGDSVFLDLDSDNHGIYRRIYGIAKKCNRRNFMDDHVRCILLAQDVALQPRI